MAHFPEAFSDLEPHADWALPTEGARFRKLIGSSVDELRVFYDAVFPRVREIRSYLSRNPLDEIPEEDRALLDLLVAFVEYAHPIELNWKITDIDDPFDADRMWFGGRAPVSAAAAG